MTLQLNGLLVLQICSFKCFIKQVAAAAAAAAMAAAAAAAGGPSQCEDQKQDKSSFLRVSYLLAELEETRMLAAGGEIKLLHGWAWWGRLHAVQETATSRGRVQLCTSAIKNATFQVESELDTRGQH